LTLPFAVAMAAVLAGMGLFVYLRVGGALLASVDQNLRAQFGEMSGHVERGERLADRDTAGAAAVGEVIGADGDVLRSTPPSLAPLLSAERRRRVLGGNTLRWNAAIPGLRGRWRLLVASVHTANGTVVLVSAASLSSRDEALDRLARELFIGGPLVLVIAILGGYLVATAALGPVEAMRARAAAITASTRERRLPVPGARDELARLATTLNDMLERLDAAFEHERRFVADASHELRTPLAMLRGEIELALLRPRSHAELEEALRSAATDTERLSQLAEDLLLIARSDRGRLPVRATTVDSNDLIRSVAEHYAAQVRQQGRSLAVADGPGLELEVDETRMEQALGNLVANALAYGAGTIELSARLCNGAVEFHVTDEGHGFAEAFIPRAFDRFSRADESRSTGGAGLGLAIVELVADAHGGTAGLANRERGGADVWISLPQRAQGRTGARARLDRSV
jgi:two-component system OmpR family sensor kinase